MSSVSTSLWISFVIVAGIQFLFFIPSAILKTEKYYDLSGSITYQTAILVALLWRHENDSLEFLTARQIIAAAGVMIWSVRLGVFLFLRVLRVKDVRFDNLKQNPIKFIGPWIIQVIWIYITALAVFIVLGNSGLESQSRTLIWSDWIGMIIWIFGFTVEVTADTQKMIFKNSNPNDFIRTGIWKYCRYANYNGEMTLWIGMFILCAHGFIESWQWIGIISPIFVRFSLTCRSVS
jgi:steroid 5-alpha reductase family enzyme